MSLGSQQPQRPLLSSSAAGPPPSLLSMPITSSSSQQLQRNPQRVILQLGNDPHSERIRSNRISAQKSREKKKREFAELQEKVATLTQEKASWKKEQDRLRQVIATLTSENLRLRSAGASDFDLDLDLGLDLELEQPRRKKSRSSSSSSPGSSSASFSSTSSDWESPSSSPGNPPSSPTGGATTIAALPSCLPLLPLSFASTTLSSSPFSPASSPLAAPRMVPEMEGEEEEVVLLPARKLGGSCHAGEASPESVTVPEVAWNHHEDMTSKPAVPALTPLPLEVFSWLLLLWTAGLNVNVLKMFLAQGAFMAETCASNASSSFPSTWRSRSLPSPSAAFPAPQHLRTFSHTKDPPLPLIPPPSS